jgi:UrcA family protein
MLKMLASAAIAAAALVAAPASAEITIEAGYAPVQARVNIADLNLASDAGQTALDRRVRFAAQQICGPEGTTDLSTFQEARKCSARAIASVKPQVQAILAARQLGDGVVMAASR